MIPEILPVGYPTFTPAVETLKIEDHLRETKIGDRVTYSEITLLIGRRIQDHRHFLASAIKRLSRDEAIYFETIRKVGVIRISDREEALDKSEHRLRCSRRRARREHRRITRVDVGSLPPSDKIRHAAYATIAATVADLGRHKHMKALEKQGPKRTPQQILAEMLGQ